MRETDNVVITLDKPGPGINNNFDGKQADNLKGTYFDAKANDICTTAPEKDLRRLRRF